MYVLICWSTFKQQTCDYLLAGQRLQIHFFPTAKYTILNPGFLYNNVSFFPLCILPKRLVDKMLVNSSPRSEPRILWWFGFAIGSHTIIWRPLTMALYPIWKLVNHSPTSILIRYTVNWWWAARSHHLLQIQFFNSHHSPLEISDHQTVNAVL